MAGRFGCDRAGGLHREFHPGAAARGGLRAASFAPGQADDRAFLKPEDAAAYAQWVAAQSYRGVMIWDVDLDNPQAPMNGTGYPKGTYVKAIGSALGS
ncbi:MAG TPA: hypothetical protein VIJ77_09400 [Candidatus Tumulicola sp.]